MRAWQYSNTKGGLEKSLHLNPSAPVPKPKSHQHLVQILATALNPVDYKPAEIPYVGRLLVPNPATPGIDFVGRVVIAATTIPAGGNSSSSSSSSSLQNARPGQIIFGGCGNSVIAGGSLAEYALVDAKNAIVLSLPPSDDDGLDSSTSSLILDAATLAVAGLTAYQSIVPRVKSGDRIFINGGSGGTGTFGIQFAKAVGCHVTTTCSTPNVELCKSLGADVVIDYKKEKSVIDALKASGHKFNHAVDNVSKDKSLYWRSHEFLQQQQQPQRPPAAYILVGGEPAFSFFGDLLKRKTLPVFLGGIKAKVEGFWPSSNPDDLEQIINWIREGKVKVVRDRVFAFEEVPAAFERLKTGRARGKILVDVVGGLASLGHVDN